MKQHITTIKNRAIDWIFKRIHVVARDSVQRFDVSTAQIADATSSSADIAVLRKSVYVSFDKRYKVISQKELKGIVSNELDFHSPFPSSYALYKLRQIDDGNWQVTYYFADLERFPALSQYRLVLIWDDFIRFWVGDEVDANKPMLVTSPLAQQHVVKEDSAIVVSDVEAGSLKQRILMSSSEQEMAQKPLPAAQFSELFFQYLLTFPWLTLVGAVNRARWLPEKQTVSVSPRQVGLIAAVFGVAVLLESAWLVGLDVYFDRQMTSTADIREQYSSAKSAYLKQLDQFSQYASVIKQRSAASAIPQLLSGYPNKADIRIDRMDYLQGEVRLGGVASDIEAFMAYLSQQGNVKDLAFMSPITQDKRSGKDRFSIRFDWHS